MEDYVMEEDRVITFGKYKGKPIVNLIMTQIGYIIWCLNNVKWFRLNDDEQILYDAFAIAILKSKYKMAFSIEDMKRHVKDKESLATLKTPLILSYTQGTLLHWPEADEKFKEIIAKYKSHLERKEGEEEEYNRKRLYGGKAEQGASAPLSYLANKALQYEETSDGDLNPFGAFL